MELSNELASQFAKITKDKKNTNTETTVYGTIVESNGLRYVQIDGSEIYTPVTSTTNVKDGERVTVMIKNHIAIVTGNITSPAARTAEVDETKDELKEEIKNLVTNVDVEYRLSDSLTEITGDYEWTTSAPELLPDTYIWTRTKTVYADPEREPEYSAARCITGDTASGRGIASIVEQYYQSISTTELIGGIWLESYPGWESGKYTWTRSVITYTSGEPIQETTDPVCVSGEKGEDGKGINSVINYYLATSLSTGVTVDTEGWTIDVQSVSADKKYLWNYEVIIYTNTETISTDPCIIGSFGEDGNGISAITEYYGRTTSSLVQPTTWSETIPTITSEYKYLWNLEIIEYTDGTTSQSGPCVIGVYGDSGRGVESVTSQWCVSTSSSIAPSTTDNWVDEMPEVLEDEYLWVRSKVVYDNGDITYTDGILDTSIEEARKVRAEMLILNDQIVTKITKGDDETLIRQTEHGVIVGRTGGEAQARVSAYGSFDVLVGGVITTSLGNRRQTIGSLTIFQTADGGTAFI